MAAPPPMTVGAARIVIVHDLGQARQVIEIAERLDLAIELRSAPDAAAYAGVGYLHALEAALGRPLVIDCGDDAGLVMAALRTGCCALVFGGPDELFERLADIAGQQGAMVRHERGRPDAVVLEPEDRAGPVLAEKLKRELSV